VSPELSNSVLTDPGALDAHNSIPRYVLCFMEDQEIAEAED
jgi:hypothetical protein